MASGTRRTAQNRAPQSPAQRQTARLDNTPDETPDASSPVLDSRTEELDDSGNPVNVTLPYTDPLNPEADTLADKSLKAQESTAGVTPGAPAPGSVDTLYGNVGHDADGIERVYRQTTEQRSPVNTDSPLHHEQINPGYPPAQSRGQAPQGYVLVNADDQVNESWFEEDPSNPALVVALDDIHRQHLPDGQKTAVYTLVVRKGVVMPKTAVVALTNG
jgi:hypothetical protein